MPEVHNPPGHLLLGGGAVLLWGVGHPSLPGAAEINEALVSLVAPARPLSCMCLTTSRVQLQRVGERQGCDELTRVPPLTAVPSSPSVAAPRLKAGRRALQTAAGGRGGGGWRGACEPVPGGAAAEIAVAVAELRAAKWGAEGRRALPTAGGTTNFFATTRGLALSPASRLHRRIRLRRRHIFRRGHRRLCLVKYSFSTFIL